MSHKLLLAHDSVTIQRVIELTFSGEDVQVVAVGDGEQAIARIPAELPDIVLADIAMPKRSGYDVAAFVKGNPELAHIPVLLLAGAFEPVDDAKAEQVGCNGVLVKPFDPQRVIARVRELLDGARGSPTLAAIATVPRVVDRLTQPRTPQPPAGSPAPAAPARAGRRRSIARRLLRPAGRGVCEDGKRQGPRLERCCRCPPEGAHARRVVVTAGRCADRSAGRQRAGRAHAVAVTHCDAAG